MRCPRRRGCGAVVGSLRMEAEIKREDARLIEETSAGSVCRSYLWLG